MHVVLFTRNLGKIFITVVISFSCAYNMVKTKHYNVCMFHVEVVDFLPLVMR